jgi:acetyl-CoA carboxylase biotin carboxylase subunit
MFRKVLTANRGEIAVRVIRACRDMGIVSVAVYSEADRKSLHVRLADEAYPIGPAPAAQSYLCIDKIIDAARHSGAEAIHPGYGFLSENPGLPRACEAVGIVFIGPSAESMEMMGSKTSARRAAIAAGAPVTPGSGGLASPEEAAEFAAGFGYPAMIKASAGGGGKGMRLVRTPQELPAAFRDAQSEALNAFGNGELYTEKYIERPRHIEIQIFGDRHGNMIHLGERECSIQRRHQKVIEECPSPFVDPELRMRMGDAAVRIARTAHYYNAGTMEFLMDANRNFYFMEMNTRLQVEHPVTEIVTGLDLVRMQMTVASGELLPIAQEDVAWRGSAVECRIYAEDPDNNFFPSPGKITTLVSAGGPGVRTDSGVYHGWTVPLEYDPLIAKITGFGSNRGEAIQRLHRALSEVIVTGIKTNIPFFKRLLARPEFLNGDLDTGFIERMFADEASSLPPPLRHHEEEELAALAAALYESRIAPLAPSAAGAAESRWKAAARDELLRKA